MPAHLLVSTRPTIAARTVDNECIIRLLNTYNEEAPYHFVVKEPDGQLRLVSGFSFIEKIPTAPRMVNLLDQLEQALTLDVGSRSVRDSIVDYGTKIHFFVSSIASKVMFFVGTTKLGELSYSDAEVPIAKWEVDVKDASPLLVTRAMERVRLLPKNAISCGTSLSIVYCGKGQQVPTALVFAEHADECFETLVEQLDLKGETGDATDFTILAISTDTKLVSNQFRVRLMERFMGFMDTDTFNNRFLLSYFD